jgi:hypothetical protein
MKARFFCALLLLIGLGWGCKKEYSGMPAENEPPETFMVADTIVRFGDDRFKSVIDVRWWGDDPDGYVAGYEFSFDGVLWQLTRSQDTSFTLNIPGNADTADFRIYVRAIDNLGEKDPTPASLVYPVKNSPPEVEFVISARTPQRSFPAVKYFWKGTDPDGDASIDRYELIWNDTSAVPLKMSAAYTEAAFVAEVLTGTTACLVYPANNADPLPDKIPGLVMDRDNILYIRSVDAVGASSQWVAAPQVYIRQPKSDVLFINGQQSAFNRANIQHFYLSKVGLVLNRHFDTLQAGPSGGGMTDLSVDPVTQDRVFSFFKKIFVYSENSEFILSFFQRSSTRFFTGGGKLMLITEGNDVVESQPPYLDFSPVGSYTERPRHVSLLYNLNDSFYGVQPGKPALRNGSTIITGIRPFSLPVNNHLFSYEPLYNGRITSDSSGQIASWKGNSLLSAKRIRSSSGEADFIIVLVPVYLFQDGPAMNLWFEEMLVNELKF